MLRRTLVKLSAAILMSGAVGMAQAYTAGEHYLVLEAPNPEAAGTLTKIWTIGCPFCYQYAKFVDPKLSRDIEDQAGLRLVPLLLESPGELNRLASEFMTYARLEDEKAGRSLTESSSLYRKAEEAWFSGFHDRGERWKEADALMKVVYDATGVKPTDFEAARQTVRLQETVDSQRWAYEAATRYGVPAYVVNGKYLVMANKLKGYDEMVKLIVELSERK